MKKVSRILLAIILVLVAGGAGILVYLLQADDDSVRKVELVSDGGTVKDLEFWAEDIVPGDVREYTIILHCDVGGDFDISFTCEDKGKGENSTLWKYIDFELYYAKEGITKTVALSDLFEGHSVSLPVYISDRSQAEFTIRYKVSEERGDEIFGLSTDFILRLTAERN